MGNRVCRSGVWVEIECLEEYESYYLGTDSYFLLMWTNSYLKTDGRFEQERLEKYCTRSFVMGLSVIIMWSGSIAMVFWSMSWTGSVWKNQDVLELWNRLSIFLIWPSPRMKIMDVNWKLPDLKIKDIEDLVVCFYFSKGFVSVGFYCWCSFFVSLCIGTYSWSRYYACSQSMFWACQFSFAYMGFPYSARFVIFCD